MKNITLSLLLAVSALMAQNAKQKMTPELLWEMGRVSAPAVSPNGEEVVYGVTHYKLEDNKGNRNLFIQPSEGGAVKQLTNLKGSEWNVRWSPMGNKLGFLSASSGTVQVWEVEKDGSNLKQISFIDGGVEGFEYDPTSANILFTKSVKLDETVNDIYKDLPKANARIIDDLMYRHWDAWSDYTYTHIFTAKYSDSITAMSDIMKGEKWSAPTKPFDGMEQITWSPDGKTIAYSCKKLSGKDFAESTNTDIYLYDNDTKSTKNLTEGMMGYDKEPVYSPDGAKIAWLSMETPGYESDKNRLFVYDFNTQKKQYLTASFNQNVSHPRWANKGNSIYFNSGFKATQQLYYLSFNDKNDDVAIETITEGDHNIGSFEIAGKYLIATKTTINQAAELYKISIKKGEITPITDVNKEIYAKLNLGKVEKRWIKTSDDKDMLVWVCYPPNFDPNKKYPALLYCQGGPQAAVSQFFSFRWNFALMAANDYIVVAPNRRGLPSFGQQWNEQISGDYGGQCMKDYLSAIDAVAKEEYVDNSKLGAVGASFGGYSVYWLAGNHEQRFNAFISHCGLFNLESWYGTTEEMFFANYDQGGAYWDLALKDKYNKFSPHKYVQNWDAPMLVIHGEKDFRVPIGEGMQAFQAAQLQGVKSKFLYFPTEGHWVLSPQNGVLWHRVFFEWLDENLKGEKKTVN